MPENLHTPIPAPAFSDNSPPSGARNTLAWVSELYDAIPASVIIVDAEMLQMMAAYLDPIAVDEASLAFAAIAGVGAGGHFFGAPHTMERYETAFHQPMISNWDNHQNWLERGAVEAPARANAIWKQLLREYRQPPIDPAIVEAIDAFIARRKAEGGAPLN
jgi:trimethylamine--corrinoid protein Co-methyltransferase